MECRNKTKEERFQLIVEMSYTLLRFLTEKNLLSEFLDECYVPSRYLDINSLTILSAFPWRDLICINGIVLNQNLRYIMLVLN